MLGLSGQSLDQTKQVFLNHTSLNKYPNIGALYALVVGHDVRRKIRDVLRQNGSKNPSTREWHQSQEEEQVPSHISEIALLLFRPWSHPVNLSSQGCSCGFSIAASVLIEAWEASHGLSSYQQDSRERPHLEPPAHAVHRQLRSKCKIGTLASGKSS